MAPLRRRIQIIDENKEFSYKFILAEYTLIERRKDTSGFIKDECDLGDHDYHIVSVLGPQSSGKSTLLNALFGTNFDIMSDERRAQTTHGIWLSKSSGSDILVMDVEGTDGREHAEDQDFERKGALFSLATSEILIINMWEHSVGLYHGANMSLLKTIIDVHLQLFKDAEVGVATTLLFVIRDFIGQTPADNLKATLLSDLTKIWDSIKKPEKYETKQIEEVFSFEFAFLPHKILKPTEFSETCQVLAERFTSPTANSIFSLKTRGKIVPHDGLAFYLESIWTKVASNKDLDLPNQQDLLAQYRCDELAQDAFSTLMADSENLCIKRKNANLTEFLSQAEQLKRICLDSFSDKAHRYSNLVYEKKLLELIDRVDGHFYPVAHAILMNLKTSLLTDFDLQIQNLNAVSCDQFYSIVTETESTSSTTFQESVHKISALSGIWDFDEVFLEFSKSISKHSSLALKARLQSIRGDIQEQLQNRLEPLFAEDDLVLNAAKIWEHLSVHIQAVFTDLTDSFCKSAGELHLQSEFEPFTTILTRSIATTLTKSFSEAKIKRLVKLKFIRAFKYDNEGRPRVWSSSDDVDGRFDFAKDQAFQLLDLFKSPAFKTSFELDLAFLDDTKLSEMADHLNKDFELTFLETKRSLIAQSSTIPPWIYVLLLILGWNEFMIIIRSPLYLMLFILVLSIYAVTSVLGIQSIIIAQIKGQLAKYSELFQGNSAPQQTTKSD